MAMPNPRCVVLATKKALDERGDGKRDELLTYVLKAEYPLAFKSVTQQIPPPTVLG